MPIIALVKRLRRRWWSAGLLDLGVVLLVAWGTFTWQSRNLLPHDGKTSAPEFTLLSLDQQSYPLTNELGKTVLLYFFAPWCQVCHLSIGNLETLRQLSSEETVSIFVIALSWDEYASVASFVQQHELTMPVLLGDQHIARQYQVHAFPTYYLIDPTGRIADRSVGYATLLGLWWRTLWVQWVSD